MTDGYSALGLRLLLIGLQSPINIGMILRVAETYQFHVSILDRFDVLGDAAKLAVIADFACGALARRGFRRVADDCELARLRAGRRLVATSIEPNAVDLSAYRFAAGDVIAFGNEYDGLSDAVLTSADAILRIPMPAVWTPKPKARHPIDPSRTAPVAREGSPNLNVAMTAGIICHAAYQSWLDGHPAPIPGTRRIDPDDRA